MFRSTVNVIDLITAGVIDTTTGQLVNRVRYLGSDETLEMSLCLQMIPRPWSIKFEALLY